MFLSNPSAPKDKTLLDQFGEALRVKPYPPRTEVPYQQWVKMTSIFIKNGMMIDAPV